MSESIRARRKRLEPNNLIFHPLYDTWRSMKRRCYDQHNHNYGRYGAKGIRVCERWLISFRNFIADMGPRPSPKHTIERMNNHGNYEPSNCRWATAKEQAANRDDHILSPDKLPKGWTVLAKNAGITHGTVYGRVMKHGWTLEQALSVPPDKRWNGWKGRSRKEKNA